MALARVPDLHVPVRCFFAHANFKSTASFIDLNVLYSVMGVVGSSICGQWFLVMVICGLWGRTWISGYAWATTISELSLNSRKFTGACFADWQPTIEKLDMSRAGVTDANIAHIVKMPNLYELSLRGTAITDACLELLAKSRLLTIDLRETKVTAAAIAKVDWDNKELKVSATQFTDDEFKFLLPLTNFTIE